MSRTVLVLAAHPDDEVLGCGGTICSHVGLGDRVVVVVVTDGSSAQYPGEVEIARKKELECRQANQLLGVSEVVRLSFPDMKLDVVPHLELNRELERVVAQYKPTIIYTHSETDLNLDHRAIAESTKVIVRPGKDYLREVFAYEVPSSTEWQRGEVFVPNMFLNIEHYIDGKLCAFGAYASETRIYPHPRSPEGIRIVAQYRGLQAGYSFAEAFALIVSYKDL